MIAKVVGFHQERTLGVVQFGTSGQNTFEYVSVGAAIGQNLIEIRELDDAGSVNAVLVVNPSDSYVFLMDGDILAGAKQNRVVNASLLLEPRSKTRIPVSCVERGRWHHVSQGFTGTTYSAPTHLRAAKAAQVNESLRRKLGFASDQGEIWGSVANYQRAHRVLSGTSNLSDVYDEKEPHLDHLVSRFVPDERANGLAVFFGKTLAAIDLFNRTEVYREYFPKILRGAAFEASAMRRPASSLSQAEAEYRTLETLDAFEQMSREEHASVGVGVDRRFESAEMTGFELVFDVHLIHLGALRVRNGIRES